MIVNIRGTSGSGKTTLVRNLMGRWATSPENIVKGKPWNYAVHPLFTNRPIMVVGSYANTCGGCDGIKTQDEICDRVRELSLRGHVLFEGLLISHLHSRYRDLARELAASGFIFAFLDTPLEVCLQRVRDRRERSAAARGVAVKPLNEKNTIDKWNNSRPVAEKFIADGLRVVWLPWENPDPALEALFT